MKSLVGSLLNGALFFGKAHRPGLHIVVFTSRLMETSKPIAGLKEERLEKKQKKGWINNRLGIKWLSNAYRVVFIFAIQILSLSRFTLPYLREHDTFTIAIIRPSESR